MFFFCFFFWKKKEEKCRRLTFGLELIQAQQRIQIHRSLAEARGFPEGENTWLLKHMKKNQNDLL